MDTELFNRFGDIPGVTFKTPPGIDRRRLRAKKTRSRRLYLDGKLIGDLVESDDSISPAARRWSDLNIADMGMDTVLHSLYETLESPGQVDDYHLAIQDVILEFWRRRRREPLVLLHVESLAWLDLRLIQTCPGSILGDEPHYFNVPAFGRLITLYKREGAWRDALAVTDIGEQFSRYPGRTAIAERVAALDAETADE